MNDPVYAPAAWPLEIWSTPAPTGVLLPNGQEIYLDAELTCLVKVDDLFVPLVSGAHTPFERLAKLRWIVAHHQYTIIDGAVVDAFTAHVILQVYEALSAEQQTKLLSFDAARMARICWRMIE